MLLTVVDYGVGNLRSIAKSVEKANSDNDLNYSVKVSSDVNDIKKSDKIILPGQGSFKACKEGIDKIKGLQETLNESVLVKKKPIYGICAGMQLFATTGHEEEKTSGLNWIPGEVIKLNLGTFSLKIPHMGWNELKIENVSKQYRLGLVGTGTLSHDLNRWCRFVISNWLLGRTSRGHSKDPESGLGEECSSYYLTL